MALIDTVRTQVREVHFGQLAISVLLFIPYAVVWALGKFAIGLLIVAYTGGWCAGKVAQGWTPVWRNTRAAAKLGWQDATKGKLTANKTTGGGRWAS